MPCIPSCRALPARARIGRREQRPEEREAPDRVRLGGGEMSRHDGPHGVPDDVGLFYFRGGHCAPGCIDELFYRKRTLYPARATRARQVEAHALVPSKGGEQRGKCIRAAAEAVNHEHRLAVAIDFDRNAPYKDHIPPPEMLQRGSCRDRNN